MTLRCRFLLLGAALLHLGPASAITTEAQFSDPAQEALYDRLVEEVRCLVCQNQTIGDSSAPLAADLRREIRDMIEAGQSESQIKDFLTERYGDFVLYKPRFGGVTSLLWIAPFALLLLGVTVLWRILRRRGAMPIPADDDD